MNNNELPLGGYTDRKGFLVKSKMSLKNALASRDSELYEYLSKNFGIFTEELDFERHFESWHPKVVIKAKELFIKEYLFENIGSDYQEVFGKSVSDIELFDKYWELETIECSQIETDSWKT